MKNKLYFLLLPALLYSCNTKQKDQEATIPNTVNKIIAADSASSLKDAHYFWAVDEENPKGILMKKTRPVSVDSLTASSMLGLFNSIYPEIPLLLLKTSGDTIFIKINKSNYLTKQIGSTGAEAYLAELTYNLTEVNGINYVNLLFKKGDHAGPGTYARTDFVRAER